MSVRAERGLKTEGGDVTSIVESASAVDASLGEANQINISDPAKPLSRTVVVSIKSSLNELCLQKQRGVWSPSPEALRSIFQQRRFTDLSGASEQLGDLSSVVLHDMKLTHTKSTFPLALGAKISGVDDTTFGATGEPFSAILLPNSESDAHRSLQADDVSLAYEFAKKFPGYTSRNLAEKGVHEVVQRRFVLIAADHPLVSAISENADKLQMGEISMMPEGLVKISQTLYESLLPLVRTQVDSQIKVRDLSKATVTLSPADYASWSDARNELVVQSKRPLKAALAAELAAAPESEASGIRAAYERKEAALEHELDHRPLDLHLSLDMSYNFLSK